MQSVSIIGCGYTGRRLAERLQKSGAYVRGFAARVESLPQIATTGAEALQLDLDEAIAPFDLTGQLVYYFADASAYWICHPASWAFPNRLFRRLRIPVKSIGKDA